MGYLYLFNYRETRTETHVEADVEAVESPAGDANPTPDRHTGARVERDVMRRSAQTQRRYFRSAVASSVHRLPGARRRHQQ